MDKSNQNSEPKVTKKSIKASTQRWTDVMSGFSPQMIFSETGIQSYGSRTVRRQSSCPNHERHRVSTVGQNTSNVSKLEKSRNFKKNKLLDGNVQPDDKKFCVDTIYALLFGEDSDNEVKSVESSKLDQNLNDVNFVKESCTSTTKANLLHNVFPVPLNGVSEDGVNQVANYLESGQNQKGSEIVLSEMREPEAKTSSRFFSKFQQGVLIDTSSQVESHAANQIVTCSQSSNEKNSVEIQSTSSMGSPASQSSSISSSTNVKLSQTEPALLLKGKFHKGSLAEKARNHVLKALSDETVFKHMKSHEKHASCVSRSGTLYRPAKFCISGPTVVFEVENSILLMFRKNLFTAIDLQKIETLTVFDVYKTIYLIDKSVVFPSLFEYTLSHESSLGKINF